MRSLSLKLLLAFALTSLASIALAALFVRQFVVSEFDAYVLAQRRDDFVAQAASYYAERGSWEGVGRTLWARLAFDDDLPERPGDEGPYGRPGPQNQPRERIGFALADANGIVLISPNPLMRGQLARSSELAGGTAVTVNGQQVGTVFVLGNPSLRNPAEERYLARTDLALGAAALGAVVVAVALGLLLSRLITRPVRDLTMAARAIAQGDLQQHVPVRSKDELGLLAVQFNQMSADLARANELRRRMTADIAHDLRTPLTVISGYLEALRDESLRATPARFATMYDETQVLLRLVQDLHTLSLADAGELPLKRQPIAPEQLLDRLATSYQHAASQQGVALATDVAPGLPALNVDVEQLARVLSNLVSNALRHTPSGGRVTLRALCAEPANLRIEVADTGSGIAAEHLPNIFERSYRIDASRTQATGGSGLGLAIVRSIVEAHGGKVSVASTLGQGTIFSILLPTTRIPTSVLVPGSTAAAQRRKGLS